MPLVLSLQSPVSSLWLTDSFNFMRRTHASRRLRAARVIGDDAILAAIHRQAIAVGSSLLSIFNVRGIPGKHGNLIGRRVLTPIARAAPSRLHDRNVLLRD